MTVFFFERNLAPLKAFETKQAGCSSPIKIFRAIVQQELRVEIVELVKTQKVKLERMSKANENSGLKLEP